MCTKLTIIADCQAETFIQSAIFYGLKHTFDYLGLFLFNLRVVLAENNVYLYDEFR